MKIACLGSAPSSRMLAPFNDPSWEIWSCSPGNMDLPRHDYFFEIHGPDTTLKERHYNEVQPGQTITFIEYCRRQPKIYMQEARPEFPGSIVYPMGEMVKEFGPFFWTSSIAYMLALAISKKPEAIALYGIDMSAGDEYGYQRAGCQFFIWIAQQRGIDIVVPFESDIMEPPPPYGYRESDQMWWKMNTRWKELHGRTLALDQQIAKLQHERTVIAGAMENVQYVCNTYIKEK